MKCPAFHCKISVQSIIIENVIFSHKIKNTPNKNLVLKQFFSTYLQLT